MNLTWLFSNSSGKSSTPAPVALKNIRVASPCRADWAQMIGDDRVRHCQECKLNVYNLSEMSRREAEELIAGHEGRLCVRFYQRADGTVLTRDCPVGFRQLVRKASRVAGAALSALMSVSFCAAQTTANGAPQATQNDQKKAGIMVTVIDPQGAVVPGAQVTAVQEGTGFPFTTVADSSGLAALQRLSPGAYRLEITAKWFKVSRTSLNITADKVEKITVKLTPGKDAVTVVVGAALIPVKESTVTHTFEGDLLRAGSPH